MSVTKKLTFAERIQAALIEIQDEGVSYGELHEALALKLSEGEDLAKAEELLLSIATDVGAMRVPVRGEYWFGGFSQGSTILEKSEHDCSYEIEWPNLSILIDQTEQFLTRNETEDEPE